MTSTFFKPRAHISQLLVFPPRGNWENGKRLCKNEKFHCDVPNPTIASNNKVNNVTIENIADTWVRGSEGLAPQLGHKEHSSRYPG